MKSLADLQRAFCNALRSPEAPPDDLLSELADDGLALQRFNVYRNNFVVLNGEALADMYPIVKRLVGDAAFRMLAGAYVRLHPPVTPSLLLYGEGFADYLTVIPELNALPYLSDVARLEYAWTEAYHAAEAGPLRAEDVARINPEEFAAMRLIPHPSMHCLRSAYPVYKIWAVNQADESEQTISLEDGASHIIVLRPDVEVETREVSAGTYAFLDRLQAGDAIADAFTCAAQADATFDLNVFFARHLFDGTFCSIRQPERVLHAPCAASNCGF